MVEKDFRNIINEVEVDSNIRQEMISFSERIKETLKQNFSSHVSLNDFQIVGSWGKGTMLKSDALEIGLYLNSKIKLDDSLLERSLFNEIENALLYGDFKINSIERNELFKEIKLTLDTEQKVNFYLNEESYLEQIQFVEFANREYTYYKNALLLIKAVCEEQHLVIVEPLIEILLYYSLLYYQSEHKYYDYLGSLCKGMEDFFSGRRIEIPKEKVEALFSKEFEKETNNDKFIVIDVATNKNLAEGLSEINVGDYRKLKKRLGKMIENPIEDKISYDHSSEVVVDVNPKLENEKYQWSFYVVGNNLMNQGGEYENTEIEFQTAILKGIFKAFKALEANGLLKKKIILQCDYDSILDKNMLTSGENKSRMRTIQTYIREHKLNIVTKKGKLDKE